MWIIRRESVQPWYIHPITDPKRSPAIMRPLTEESQKKGCGLLPSLSNCENRHAGQETGP